LLTVLALVNFFPIVGAAINLSLGAVATLLFLAMEYVDYTMDRRHLGLRSKLSIIRFNLGLMLGFGCGVFVLLLIPLVNLFGIPASVAGGTMLCAQRLLAVKESGEASISIGTPSV